MKLHPFAVTVSVLAGALQASTAYAEYNIKTIGSCTTITESWSYALDKTIIAKADDLQQPAGACILIAADYVTLDLQGYTIIGPPDVAGATGIRTAAHQTGVKVRNGNVTNFGGFGVHLLGKGHTIERINASNNGLTGIQAISLIDVTGGGHRAVSNTANFNDGHGISIECPSVVLDNVATGNGGVDINVPPALCTRLGNFPAP